MTRTSLPWTRLVVALAVIALLVAGCSGPATPPARSVGTPTGSLDLTGNPDEKSPTWSTDLDPASTYGLHKRRGLETVVRAQTRVLTDAEAATLTAVTVTNRDACLARVDNHPACEFELHFSALPAGVAVGSVLNAGITATTPEGLLVKVISIDGLVVRAVQAGLSDALVQGEYWVERAFSPDRLRGDPVLAPGVKFVPRVSPTAGKGSLAMPDFDVSLPGELSIDVEPVSGVHLSGAVDFGAGCGLDGGVGGSDIAWVETSCHAWEKARLNVSSTGAGAGDSTEYPVADIPLAGFVIPIGPLVVVVIVDIVVTVDLSGGVHAGLHYGASQSTEVYGSLAFSLGHGLDHDGGVKTSAYSTASGLSAPVDAAATGRAKLRISAYGVLGFAIGAEASVLFSGGPGQTPRWRLRGNAGIFVEVSLGLLGYSLWARITYHLGAPFLIAEHSNDPPVVTISWPTEGVVVRKGSVLPPQAQATAVDPEDGNLPVTWTDDLDHVTVTGSPKALPFNAIGRHTVVATATDSQGRSGSATVHVDVQGPTLTLALTPRSIAGTVLAKPPAVSVGAVVLVDATIGGSALTAPSCSGLTWSASNATIVTDGTCRARITAGSQVGSATITATITDSYGTSATGTSTIAVRAVPPAPPTPLFEAIDVTTGGLHLTSPASLIGAEAIVLTARYLNADVASVPVTYAWTYTRTGQAPVSMPAAGAETTTSTRNFTPPTPWGYAATFTVVIANASTGSVLATRTFAVSWQSLPK